MELITRKEKVAQYLLSQNKWLSAVDIANGLGVDKELIYPVMRGVLREKRYSVESKLAPRNMPDGPMKIKLYLITAIEPAAPKPETTPLRPMYRLMSDLPRVNSAAVTMAPTHTSPHRMCTLGIVL